MEKEEIEVLKSEVNGQIKEIENIYLKLEERSKSSDKYAVESISLWLHHLYSAFEDLFKIIAKAFENSIVDESRYHIELLRRMTIVIDGVRPALLSKEVFPLFDELRSFRHRLRHAYVYDIEVGKVEAVLDVARNLKDLYQKEVDNFFSKLGS